MLTFRKLLLSFLCILSVASSLLAAPVGSVTGTVKDSSSAIIPNVKLVLTNVLTNKRAETVTSSAGQFQFLQLEPAQYTLTAEAAGFKRSTIDRVLVEVDQSTRADLTMEVGSLNETVNVEAAAPLIETDQNTLSSVVDSRTISNMPLNARQFLDLALLTPGALPAATGTQGGGFNVGGMRSQSNNFLIDGISNIDTQINSALNNFRITDAVEEFSVQTSVSQAEFGRGTGAQVNVVTKSGTNGFHGSAFEYLRNTDFNAADFFANKNGAGRSILKRNQYGATLGGPIIHNKTFFFLSWEGFRQIAPTVSSTRVPTAAERAIVTDPISKRLLQYWPDPNTSNTNASINYVANIRSVNSDDTGLVKIDHTFNEKDHLSGRWIKYQGTSVSPGAIPVTGGTSNAPVSYSSVVNEVHSFSPNFLNDYRFGFSRNKTRFTVQDTVNASSLFTDASGVPLPGIVNSTSNPRDIGLPTINVQGGFASLGSTSNQPQGRITTTYEMFDNMSLVSPFGWTHHFFKWGFHIRREDARRYLDGSARGVFSFVNFSDFAAGLINTSSERSGNTLAYFRRYPWDIFLQDQFKITSTLTLNYGLRYEYPSAVSELRNHGANFVPGTGIVLLGTNQLLQIDPTKTGPASLVLAQAPYKLPSSGVFSDKNNFAPVLGIAWSPHIVGKPGSTVLRAGVRSGYDDIFNNIPANQALNPPATLVTAQTANVTQPGKFDYATALSQDRSLISNYNNQGPGHPTAGVLSFNAADPNIRSAYSWNYNAGIQQLLTDTVSLEVDYIGSEGHRLGIYVDANQPYVQVNNPGVRGTLAPNQQFFPYPQYGSISQGKSIGNSNYNSMVATSKYRGKKGIFLQGSYTYGKSLDLNSSYFGSLGESGSAADGRNLRLEHGPSSFDIRNRFVGVYVIDLPIGPGHRLLGWNNILSRELFGGWTISGITTLQTGAPFTVYTGGSDYSGFNQFNDRPNVTRAGQLPQQNRNPATAFDTTFFALPGPGIVGTSGRNQYYGPGLANYDFSVAKDFALFQRHDQPVKLQFRADFFNLFNHTNFANPVATMSNSNFGKITQTVGSAIATSVGTTGGANGGPRLAQLSLRLQF